MYSLGAGQSACFKQTRLGVLPVEPEVEVLSTHVWHAQQVNHGVLLCPHLLGVT